MQLIGTRDFINIISGTAASTAARQAAGQGPTATHIGAVHRTLPELQLPMVDESRACLPTGDLAWLRARADSLPHIRYDDHRTCTAA